MAKQKQPKKQTKRGRAPHGQIGPQTFAQVRKIADEKGIPLVKAFEEVAKATNRKASTVAVTYYRIARRQGATGKKRVGTARRGRPPGSGGSKMPAFQKLRSRVSAVIQELENVIAHQAREIARLKGESRLADRIRKAFRE
jgi:hypothetical protein